MAEGNCSREERERRSEEERRRGRGGGSRAWRWRRVSTAHRAGTLVVESLSVSPFRWKDRDYTYGLETVIPMKKSEMSIAPSLSKRKKMCAHKPEEYLSGERYPEACAD
ncbi:hypothetical protein H6P81_009050 [Aristolochia fimbriata]|uniref:Uncharacterized protein n=1 Tax=Aristolochia fimbriata TaxID=158543 RepID=A0AAV7EJQ2_ARIFI|nr:hypothetical protein H6P81_009050 [Aristolochia fimbriata]